MLNQTHIARLESAAIIAADRSRPGAVLLLTGARDALGYAEFGSQWLRRQIDRLIAALAEPARALDCADAPDMPPEAMRSPAPCAEPQEAPAAARPDETGAPEPKKRRGRPPKAKPAAAAETMAEPAEMAADAPTAEMAEPIAPAIPVPETAGAHPIVETAGDEPPVPPKPRRGRKPKAATPIEAASAETVTAPPADTPIVETADYTPVPQMAGRLPKRRGPAPKPVPLFRALASAGGLAPCTDLEAILDGNPTVPRAGRLIRKKGMSLDAALQVAKDLGYFFDPADYGAGELTISINDLLDAIAAESHGRPLYPIGTSNVPSVDYLLLHRNAMKALRALAELQPCDDGWTPSETILDRAAWLMAYNDSLAPLAAYEDAAAAYERELWEERKRAFDAMHQEEIMTYDGDRSEEETQIYLDGGSASGGREEIADAGNHSPVGSETASIDGGSGRDDGGAYKALPAELTEQGMQILVPGVAAVRDLDRAEFLIAQPMRGGNAAPGGMFDEDALAQIDFLDAGYR